MEPRHSAINSPGAALHDRHRPPCSCALGLTMTTSPGCSGTGQKRALATAILEPGGQAAEEHSDGPEQVRQRPLFWPLSLLWAQPTRQRGSARPPVGSPFIPACQACQPPGRHPPIAREDQGRGSSPPPASSGDPRHQAWEGQAGPGRCRRSPPARASEDRWLPGVTSAMDRR